MYTYTYIYTNTYLHVHTYISTHVYVHIYTPFCILSLPPSPAARLGFGLVPPCLSSAVLAPLDVFFLLNVHMTIVVSGTLHTHSSLSLSCGPSLPHSPKYFSECSATDCASSMRWHGSRFMHDGLWSVADGQEGIAVKASLLECAPLAPFVALSQEHP